MLVCWISLDAEVGQLNLYWHSGTLYLYDAVYLSHLNIGCYQISIDIEKGCLYDLFTYLRQNTEKSFLREFETQPRLGAVNYCIKLRLTQLFFKLHLSKWLTGTDDLERMLGLLRLKQMNIQNMLLVDSINTYNLNLDLICLKIIDIYAYFGHFLRGHQRKGLVLTMRPFIQILYAFFAICYLVICFFQVL